MGKKKKKKKLHNKINQVEPQSDPQYLQPFCWVYKHSTPNPQITKE